MPPSRLLSLFVIGLFAAVAATENSDNSENEFEPYRRQLYASLAAQHLQPGSLAEAIAFQRIIIRISEVLQKVSHKRTYATVDALPADAIAILRRKGHQCGHPNPSAAALAAIVGRFNALRRLKTYFNVGILGFTRPLEQLAIQQLVATSSDVSVGIRLSAIFSDEQRSERQSFAEAMQRLERITHNFQIIAARPGTRPETCVSLVRLATDEVRDALQKHDNETIGKAKQSVQSIEAILQRLDEQSK